MFFIWFKYLTAVSLGVISSASVRFVCSSMELSAEYTGRSSLKKHVLVVGLSQFLENCSLPHTKVGLYIRCYFCMSLEQLRWFQFMYLKSVIPQALLDIPFLKG